MDRETYLWWQKYFQQHPALAWGTNLFASRLAALAVAVPLLVVWYPAGRLYVVWAGVCLLVGWLGLVQGIAALFPRRRPYQQFGFVPVGGVGLFSHVDTRPDAFPSGHTTALAVLAFSLFAFSSGAGMAVAMLAVAAGSARVLLGWHFVQDIAAGIALAGVVVAGLYYGGVFGLLQRFVV